MSFYTHTDKQSGDGLAITNWNDLSSAVAGNSGLTLALNPADKIGIGTTSPTEKLEVNGNIQVNGQYVVQNMQNGGVNRGIYMWGANDNNWGIYMGQSGVNRALDGGSAPAGFGFSSHAIRFRANSHSSNGFIFENNQNQSLFSVRGSDGYSEFKGDVKATKFIGDGSGLINLPVSSTWDQNGNAISYSSGNVGIGTTSPTKKLHLEAGELRVRSSHNNSTADIGAFMAQNLTQGIGIGYNRIEAVGSNSDQDILILPKNNGKVGIGTNSPKQRLHVNGDYYGKGHVYFYANEGDGNSGTAYLQARDTSGTSSISLQLRAQQNGTVKDIMRLDPNGNVKINGALYVSSVPYGDYKNAQWNDYTGQFYQDNSSRRSKRNIKALKDDFYAILQAEPKTYTRPGAAKRWELGYIAEEFEELGLKKLVYYDREGKPDGINYAKICMYLLEIVKDHEQKIETLLSGKKQD